MARNKAIKCGMTIDGKLLFPSKYLTGDDLGGKDITVTISKVSVESLATDNGDTEGKLILSFVGAKKRFVVSCKENAANIVKATGIKEARNLVGKAITLYPLAGRWFGEDTVAVRVRPKTAQHGVTSAPPQSMQCDDPPESDSAHNQVPATNQSPSSASPVPDAHERLVIMLCESADTNELAASNALDAYCVANLNKPFKAVGIVGLKSVEDAIRAKQIDIAA